MLSTIKIKSLLQNGGDTSKDLQKIKCIKSQSPKYGTSWIFWNRLIGKKMCSMCIMEVYSTANKMKVCLLQKRDGIW